MNFKSLTNYLCAAALALLSTVASAGTVYKFELTGAYVATWQLTTPVIPDDSFAGQQFTLWNVLGSFVNASTSRVDITFFNSTEGGGFNIYDFAAGVNLLSTDGPQLYAGAEGAPTSSLGTFVLNQFQGQGRYTLTVAEVATVPEPAFLPLLVAGFLVVGTATRKQWHVTR
jgi:hypothetical protein